MRSLLFFRIISEEWRAMNLVQNRKNAERKLKQENDRANFDGKKSASGIQVALTPTNKLSINIPLGRKRRNKPQV